ncbi:EAL domain-containing protein [endosymbiont of Lamellibrachia barhami]|uniref:EAL domain-containing protein n=1 Tax=endosymbiont of Lamellibrachia barhami TaxID=205975 RepID=UPI0015AE904C|nr:EAL domain-containing protein [endosymbiont of Lamellibrachia barhami]
MRKDLKSRKPTIFLVVILMLIAALVAAATFILLYRAAFSQHLHHLSINVNQQAQLIGAVARFDRKHAVYYAQDAVNATLSQIDDALRSQSSLKGSEEFIVGRRLGDTIKVISRTKNFVAADPPNTLPWSAKPGEAGSPMRQALAGKQGTMVLWDYRGAEVMAAFAPVKELGIGLVIKTDVADVRAPYLRAGILVAVVSVLLVLLGSLLVRRVTQPIISNLESSDARYRNLLDNMPNCVAVYQAVDDGEDFIFSDFNQAGERAERIVKADLIGQRVSKVFPEVKIFGLFDVLQRVWKTGKPEQFPMAFYRDDRISGWRDNYIYKLNSGEVVAIYEDVTEKKTAEQKLADSERILSAIVDATPDWIFIKDHQYRYLFANESYARAIGTQVESMLGKTDEELGFPTELIQGDEERGIMGFRQDDRAALQGEHIHNPHDPATFADGSLHVFDTHKMPLYGTNDQIYGVLGIARDITALDQTLNDLRINDARLSLAEAIGQLGHWDWDIVGNRLTWSDEIFRIFGQEPGSVQETYETFLNAVHAEDRERVKDAVNTALESDEPYSIDHRIVLDDGNVRWVHEEAELERDEEGYPLKMLGVVLDITNLKEAEEKAEQQRIFLQNTIDGITDPVRVIDHDYNVLLMNSAAKAAAFKKVDNKQCLKCYQAGHGLERPCDELETPLYDHPCPMKTVFFTGKPMVITETLADSSGKKRTYELSFSPLRTLGGELQGVIETSRDITDRLGMEQSLLEKESHLEQLTYLDQLTHLPNRLLFMDRLRLGISAAHRENHPLAVLYIDLDRFKQINESFGHEVGDQLLLDVALRLRGTLREDDTLARFSGDEFVVITGYLKQPEHSAVLAQKLLRSFDQPFEVAQHQLYLTASVGISIYPQDGTDADELLRDANTAMFQAKGEGINSFQFYRDEMTAQAFEHVLMETSLRGALEEDQLRLYYQPQISLENGRIIGAEALLRWEHPDMGLVSPAKFIPLAEETGLILPIGEWVTRTACRQLKAWKDAGIELGCMAINLSAKQFRALDLVETVTGILQETCCPAQRIEFEITESQIMDNSPRSIQMLDKLRDLGVGISIDDFGTGYSSMGQLKSLPITKLKIDRVFVRDVAENADDQAIAEAIIAMAKALGLVVIAEGVETVSQKQCLQQMGCQQVQGFLYQRPVPAEAFARYVEEVGLA